VVSVAALDVNETLSDMSALAARLEDMGAPGDLLGPWFAATLRDGFALTTAGGYADFAAVAVTALASLLARIPSISREPEEAASLVLGAIAEIPLHDDVRPGLARLHRAGIRLVTLTNGSATTAQRLLDRGEVATSVERYPEVFEPPGLVARDFVGLADILTA
jgi:2-haloacid dehalogenase